MTSLALTQTFVNLVSTGAFVAGGAAPGRAEDYKINGNVRTYASGRQRSISTAGEVGSFTFQLRYVPRSTVDTLRLWINQLVQVRDARSRIFYGVYFETAIEEVTAYTGSWCTTVFDAFGAWHVGITLSTVTYTPGV